MGLLAGYLVLGLVILAETTDAIKVKRQIVEFSHAAAAVKTLKTQLVEEGGPDGGKAEEEESAAPNEPPAGGGARDRKKREEEEALEMSSAGSPLLNGPGGFLRCPEIRVNI